MTRIISFLGLVPGAGTTFVSTNIAALLAYTGVKTILIDFSVRGVLGSLYMNEAAREIVHPTIETWREFSSPVESLMRTAYDLAVLSGPTESNKLNNDFIEDLLNYFKSHFEVMILDTGCDVPQNVIKKSLTVAETTFLIAEPTQRCTQAIPEHYRVELMKNNNLRLLINKVSSKAYYHPHDIARWLGVEKYLAVPDEPARVNDATKRRIPLVLHKGKACAALKKVVEYVLKTDSDGELNSAVADSVHKDFKVKSVEKAVSEFKEPAMTREKPLNRETVRQYHPEERIPDLPDGFVALGEIPGAKCFANIEDICASEPLVVLINSELPNLVNKIKSLRREFSLSAVPVIVVGSCNTEACYSAGADECVDVLDSQTVERICARSVKMREMWEKATKDDLTGLYKRNFLENYLKELERRWKEICSPFSVLMCDLDYFKKINDTYGHPAGDAVLKLFAQYLTKKVRGTDIIARYGGEEFLVVFPCLGDVWAIANKLCSQWASEEIIVPGGERINSTFSAGLAVMGQDAKDAETIISVADQALYRAKKSGRNRVVSASEKMELPIDNPQEVPVAKEDEIFKPQGLIQKAFQKSKNHVERVSFANGCTVITICSPCTSGGSSSFASVMAGKLAKNARGKIAAFDCDLEGKGLGLRMGVKLIDLENRDWRKNDIPLEISGVRVYPLDPSTGDSINDSVNKDIMVNTLQSVSQETDKLIIDLGSNFKSWWFNCGHSMADLLFWVIRNDPLLLEKAKLNWANRPKAGCREFLVLHGEGSPKEMEEIFMLPCYQVTDKKGFKQVEALMQSKLTKGRRVLVVGFKKVPKVDGFVCDVFARAEEAAEWVKYNVPDVALLSNKLSKVALLEYDLKKIGVPAKKVNEKDIMAELQNISCKRSG